MKTTVVPLIGGVTALLGFGLLVARAQEQPLTAEEGPAVVEHAECSLFSAAGAKARQFRPTPKPGALSRFTAAVSASRQFVPGGSRTRSYDNLETLGTVDRYLFQAMQDAGVTPADTTTDAEFLRRATLDLTGRIPTPEQVTAFLNDASADKRAKLLDDLLSRPEWVDKWTMYFGDLFANTSIKGSVNLRRYPPGRNAFYQWIKDQLAANRPYNEMAAALISARGENSWAQGDLNWVLGGWVINNPEQDNWDQAAANTAETFLGIGHMNCVLCHNGRGHLDALSLWGKSASRMQAWGMASFFSRITMQRVVPNRTVDANTYYWHVDEITPRLGDYPLNTTTGNRPARQPIGGTRNVAPVYPFSRSKPAAGENYRVSLAREVTSDFQFARAAVNYIWKEFFSLGIVEPVNQFDPARLDPDNPPPDPWTLQPSNARLLNALAQDFIDHNYDLKWLMRTLANSHVYQLSSSYSGTWQPEWEKLYARKLVRRLWAEEVHDAIAQSSGILPSYNVDGFSSYRPAVVYSSYPTFGPVIWAMQLPETADSTGVGANGFLDSFIRGDRDNEDRRPEASLLQAINLMNDPFVTGRIRSNGPATSLLVKNLRLPDAQLVTNLFLAVLSRYPSDGEMQTARTALASGNRNTQAENLLWSLYNKVDFFINY